MPTATASPWRSSWCESCSSLCAAQWPKSSGREEPSSNGSPLVAMWSRCSSALRCTSRAIASIERSRRSRAWCSIQAKYAASLSSATLTASEMPARQSRSASVSSSSKSFSTACGGENEPMKFFLPKALMPFFTPTAESSCARTVVGTRIRRTPRCAVAAA